MPDYKLMANQFEQSNQQFFQSQTARHQNSSLEISVYSFMQMVSGLLLQIENG